MADARKLQEVYDALVGRFVLPVLEGGAGQLGRPIAPACFSYFVDATATSPEVDDRIFDALHRAASGMVPVETIRWPTPGLVALAAAAHDLIALTDPSLEGWLARGARTTMLSWTDKWTRLIPAPTTRGEALARHALLAPLLGARRKDVVLRTWMYTYRFQGRALPFAEEVLPGFLKRGSEETSVGLAAMLGAVEQRAGIDLRARLEALVSRSPVTELLTAGSRRRFQLGLASLAVLSDPALRGAIAREIAAENEWAAASALGAAVAAPRLGKEKKLLAIGVRFLCEIQQTRALEAREDVLPSSLDPGQQLYAALLPAMLEHPRTLEELRLLDDGDRAKLQLRAEKLRPRIGPEPLAQALAWLEAS